MDDKVLFLRGVFKEKIWGSIYFKDKLKLTTKDGLIGEYWSASGHPEGSSIITNGTFQGQSLNEVYRTHKDLFGTDNSHSFPLLVKIIATTDDLSIQVHPSDLDTDQDNGKAEGWLFLDVEPNSQIVLGHKAKNKQAFLEALSNNTIKEILNYYPVHKGMYRFINPGVVHSLGKGIVILEVQQSSDLTYRIYDYDRLDDSNKKRKLHIDEALKVIKYDYEIKEDDTDYLAFSEDIMLDQNQYFQVKLINVKDKRKILNVDKKMNIVTVIDGEINVFDHQVKMGESFIITTKCYEISVYGMGKIALIKTA